ncbi:hypothetical protein ILYODFUR_001534 [Ilyodon furcidens]|uniref:Secreted protein n=1 Tax=Ilyodon furcidens TaxID=33524 RepID=A0ABV0UN33_9TELE
MRVAALCCGNACHQLGQENWSEWMGRWMELHFNLGRKPVMFFLCVSIRSLVLIHTETVGLLRLQLHTLKYAPQCRKESEKGPVVNTFAAHFIISKCLYFKALLS